MGICYFINNLKESKSRTDIEAGGFLKHKVKSNVGGERESDFKGGNTTR